MYLKTDTHLPGSLCITSQWPNAVLQSPTGSEDLTTIAVQSGTPFCDSRNWGNIGKICNFGSHSMQSHKAESWTVGEWNRRTKQAREISAKVASIAYNRYRYLVHILWALQVRNSCLSTHGFCLTEQARYRSRHTTRPRARRRKNRGSISGRIKRYSILRNTRTVSET